MSSCIKPIRLKSRDQHRHKILVILVFFMAISEILKIKTPSNIHKQAQKLSKREEMKKKKMKKIEDMV